MDEIKNWIINISAAVILSSIANIIMPEGKMKKIMQVCTGLIVLMIMLNPVVKVLKGSDLLPEVTYDDTGIIYEQSNMPENLYSYNQIKAAIDLYKSNVEDSIKERIEDMDIVENAKVTIYLNEYEKQDNIKISIKGITAEVVLTNGKNTGSIRIEDIKINDSNNNGQESKKQYESLYIRIKDIIKNITGIEDEDNIKIFIN